MASRVLEHYLRDDVAAEIAEFTRGRWLALEGQGRDGRIFVRWWAGKPLTASTPTEVKRLVESFSGAGVRTIYATACIYRSIAAGEDVERIENVVAATPSWDIDATLDSWEAAVEAAKLIVGFLERHGVRESVYLKWSGEGVHVHIHEAALSEKTLALADPLTASRLLVEYTIRKLENQLKELAEKWRVLKVENLMDPKRVFTVPLSFHRRVDKVAVCFKPDQLDDFDPSWADPASFKHNPRWRDNVPGEADQLALEALKALAHLRPTSTRVKVEEPQERGGAKLGRFQVMALLQAARYYALTGDLEKAKSFGLNRAIFYAWAKHYGPSARTRARESTGRPRRAPAGGRESVERVSVLGEEAYITREGWFAMGGIPQRPEDYDRQVARIIESVIPYEEAWRKALEYVGSFPRSVLEDPQEFYSRVYEPVRDEFVEKVLRGRKQSGSTLDAFFS
ncbi:MAG: hypothetical protein QW448_09020 [Thermofilaceae archaeon]